MGSKAALSIRNLSIKDSQDNLIIKDLSFEIQPSEIVCIQGESGVGKTITALAVMDLLPPSLKISEGEIQLNDYLVFPDITGKIKQLRGRTVSMVFQEPGNSFDPLRNIGEQMSDVHRVHNPKLSPIERRHRVNKALTDIGFDDVDRIYQSFHNELSGGQLQRCLLASSLLTDIDLLIADEPTSSLDNTSRDEVLDVITQLNRTRGMSVLIITHDYKVADRVAHRVLTLTDNGISNFTYSHSTHTSTDNRNKLSKGLEESGKNFIDKQSIAVHVDGLTKKFQKTSTSLFNRNDSRNYAIKELSLSLRTGEILGITGPSGSGKTTLARCLVGLLPWEEGSIEINGHIVQPIVRPQRSADLGIQMIWQHPFSVLNPVMHVEEIISENIRRRLTRDKVKINNLVMTALDQVELSETLLRRRPSELSGGQCQRVAIASILVLNPIILVADEPVSYLDYKTKINILKLLEKLRDDMRLSIIIMSHDLDAVNRISDRTIEIEHSKELVGV